MCKEEEEEEEEESGETLKWQARGSIRRREQVIDPRIQVRGVSVLAPVVFCRPVFVALWTLFMGNRQSAVSNELNSCPARSRQDSASDGAGRAVGGTGVKECPAAQGRVYNVYAQVFFRAHTMMSRRLSRLVRD